MRAHRRRFVSFVSDPACEVGFSETVISNFSTACQDLGKIKVKTSSPHLWRIDCVIRGTPSHLSPSASSTYSSSVEKRFGNARSPYCVGRCELTRGLFFVAR